MVRMVAPSYPFLIIASRAAVTMSARVRSFLESCTCSARRICPKVYQKMNMFNCRQELFTLQTCRLVLIGVFLGFKFGGKVEPKFGRNGLQDAVQVLFARSNNRSGKGVNAHGFTK